MKTYRLHFKLVKQKKEKGFMTIVTVSDSADVQGLKEEYAMHFEEMYGTPVKCAKVEEVV